MRIILSNKFYYDRGGDCNFMINLEQLLISYGHDIAIFTMDYHYNLDSKWKEYFPSNMNKLMAFTRPFGSKEVIKKFTSLINHFQPDIVHLNNIHTQLSPIIAEIAHQRGIKVIWTLHDSKLVCPCYTCMRNKEWCTECFTDKRAVIRHKCMPGGIIGSTIGYLEAKKWNPQRLQACTDLFLSPSQFLANICISGGYNKNKIKVLYNFINIEKVNNPSFEKEDYYVFLGRLTKVKGIRTLCKVAKELPYKLIVIGGGELEEELFKEYRPCKNIDFIGQKEWNNFRPILEKARFMVIPSECSENNPLSAIEAQSLGIPVLGANIGGIPELIKEGINGMTFESGNVKDLKEKIQRMFSMTFNYKNIAKQALERYSSETYYKKLISLYTQINKE